MRLQAFGFLMMAALFLMCALFYQSLLTNALWLFQVCVCLGEGGT
jgi:hypothetical protein